MISFELSEEQRVARATIGEFARSVLRPDAREADQTSRVDAATPQEIWSTGIIQAQAIEGDATTGRSPVMNALLLEERAAADATLALAAGVPMAFVQAIADPGGSSHEAWSSTTTSLRVGAGGPLWIGRASWPT